MIIKVFILLINILPMQKKFPFQELKVMDVFYEFTQEIENDPDAELELIVDFNAIYVEGQTVNCKLEFIGLSSSEIEEKVFSDGYRFDEGDEIEPSSIYIASVHNPVDLKFLKIERMKNEEVVTVELYFDFEYEGTDYKNGLFELQLWKKI